MFEVKELVGLNLDIADAAASRTRQTRPADLITSNENTHQNSPFNVIAEQIIVVHKININLMCIHFHANPNLHNNYVNKPTPRNMPTHHHQHFAPPLHSKRLCSLHKVHHDWREPTLHTTTALGEVSKLGA